MNGNGRSFSLSHQDGEASCERQSKRRRVAEPERKRVAKACLSCRRLKEKCDGASPCSRCVRYRRTCGTGSSASESFTSSAASSHEESSERSACLETIARHFLGNLPMDTESLKRVVENLKSQASTALGPSASANDARWSRIATAPLSSQTSKLSDAAFTHRLRNEVQERMEQAGLWSEIKYSKEQPNTTLWSFTGSFRRESLPPKDVAVFLLGIYFDFAQSTTLLVEQPWIDDKIERLYSCTVSLSPQDHPWLCSVLTILAIGVRYAHLADVVSHENPDGSQASVDMDFDRNASDQFYQLAAELIPDTFLLPCVESMQAFLLLTQLALTWNEPSQAYAYLGVATRVAAQVDIQNMDQEARRTYWRLCQVAYAWDSRIRILHGISSSSHNEIIDLNRLQLRSADTQQQQLSLEASTTLFFQLTSWLKTFAQSLLNPDGKATNLQRHSLDRIMEVRCRYKKWWSDLKISRIPILQLNRRTASIHLCYNLNLVFMGRSFAFYRVENLSETELSIESQNAVAELVDEAEYSAYEIIDICAMLDKSAGVSGVRYIDASACQAAVSVMLAQSLVGRCHLFRSKLQEGLNLVRKMNKITPSYDAGRSTVHTISEEIEKFAPHRRNQKYKSKLGSPVDADNAYRSFQDWARGGSNRPNTDLADLDALIRSDGNECSGWQDTFDCNLLDSSLFAFDSTACFDELEQGVDVN